MTARAQFLDDYRRIRTAEHRGSSDPAYYRQLPYHPDPQWQIRARTFDYFATHILPKTPSRILDLGAGNCWLSHRLAERGHSPLAVDIFSDPLDGLSASRHYPTPFPTLEADFNHLPVPNSTFDLAIYNASIHYSSNYETTLKEARRVLAPEGRVIILDSPIYKLHEHGEQMRTERQASFQQQYGFRSEALHSIEFFDEPMLKTLEQELNMTWEIHRPWYGWRWHLRPLQARLKNRRPPSRFWILVGRFHQ